MEYADIEYCRKYVMHRRRPLSNLAEKVLKKSWKNSGKVWMPMI